MRNIPDDNLAYPVLITLNTGNQGSGFQLNTGNAVYLITAKHVLYKDAGLIGESATLFCPSRAIDDQTVSEIRLNFNVLQTNKDVAFNNNADVCAVKLADY